jgi:chaperonin GroEL
LFGGGVALLELKAKRQAIKPDNADEVTGIQIISRAVESPLEPLMKTQDLKAQVVAK